MVKKGCEKTQSNRETKMECNMKVAHVGNQQNVFESQQYFPQMSSGDGYKHQNMHMGHSKYPSNEQFYQRSGSVLSSQSIPGTLQNMQHVQSHQYKSPNYYANASQTVFQQVSYPAGVLKEASSNQKYNRNTNKMHLEYMHQKNCVMPAYYEYGTSALPQSINKQFSYQPTAAYQKVPGHVSFTNAGEVSGNKSGQNSDMQVTSYSSHLGSQTSYDVQSEWPPNLSSELTQRSSYNSVNHLHGESLPKQMQSQVPEQVQQQRHVQLPEEVLKLLQPKQLYKNGDASVQNQPSLYSNAQNIYDWDHQPQKISTENCSNSEVVSSCTPHNANCDATLSPRDTSSNVSGQASADLLQRVLRYGHEYKPTSAPANTHNLHMGTMPVQGNYSVYRSNGFPNSIIHSLNPTENSEVSNEAMVHKKVFGAKDNFMNARWHCNNKYEMFKSVHSDGNIQTADVHGSDTSPNICGNGLNGDSWSVVPHAATSSQTPEALSSYKTVYHQNLQMQSYSSQEENYASQTSMGNTEGLHRLGLQIVKSSPTLTALSSHCAQDQNEPALSNPFTNYLRNKYLTLEEVNKSHESVKKTKSSDFIEGVKSEQSHDQCALAYRLSASASKSRNNIQSGHPNHCTVPDRNGNPVEKELLKYSAKEQTCKPKQNDTSDRGINLPSPNSKSTASESVTSTVASQTGQTRSLPIAVKQEPSDLMQDTSHLDLCNKMTSRTDGSDEQPPTKDVDLKQTLPPRGLCEQNDGVLNKSKKAVCLNEKTNTASSIDVGNQCCDRAVTGRKPDLFGINIKKSAEPQIAVVNPLTPSKSESPSKDQENVPPRNGMYHDSQEALRGPLSQQRKRKLAIVSTNGNIDHTSSVNMLLDILGSDAAINCPGSQKVIPMTCDLNSKISDPQSKAKKYAPAVDSTKPLLQLKSKEFAQPHTSPLCQEKPQLQLVDGAVLLVNGACEEQLQISSVCTLVEGSTFYDSQIAKIFDAHSLEQSKDPNIESEELGVLQKNEIMGIKNKPCESEVLESPTERPHLDSNCKGENQNNPVRSSNCSNQTILVSNSEPEQTVLKTLNKNKEAFVELAIANENGLSSNPLTSQMEKDCCRSEGELKEQMTNMAASMQEEMPEGDEASSEPYLNSQLSELLRMFPFGIDRMETGATSEESDVLEEDKDGSNFSQLQEHEPDEVNTVSSPVVGQAEKTPSTKQAEVKGLQCTNDCNVLSPGINPKNGDTVDKEKGEPKSKDFQLVSGLGSDRTVYSMQSEKLCSLQKQSIALLNSQHPGFLFPANAGQPPCDTNGECRENAKELTAMANGTGSNQISCNAFVGMGTMQPVSSNFLLSVYSGEKRGFYLNNMAANSKTSSFKHDATYRKSVNHQIDEHSYFHVNSSSQINGNSEIEDPTKFNLTHQAKILQNCLPETGVGWHKIEWVNSAMKLNCLPVEQNVYCSSDARKSGTCESKGEQNRLMLQHVTTPTAGGTHVAYGYQDSIFKKHPPNTHSYHKVDHKSLSPKKHKEQSCLVGLSKEKKKKSRLIVNTDFLKPKANKTKACQKTAEVHGVKLFDDKHKVSENGCIKSMLSSNKCVTHSAKLGENVQVALPVNASCSMTDGGLMGKKQGVKEHACEESKDPQTVIHDAVVAEEHLHNLAVQEFFQRRKAEQNTGGKKIQPAWEKHKAKQPVQYRKPSIILEKLEEGNKRKNEASLEENLSQHPKKATQKPMESIGENFLTRIAFTGYENGVIQLVNFDFLNSPKNTLSLKASKPVVTKKPQTPAEEPKVLEFKLCPGELLRGHTADDDSSVAGSPVSPDDSSSEEIQNKADASSSNIPLKKRKVDMALLQGNISVPKPMPTQDIFSTEKTSHPQTPNSKVLFSAFKKLYLEMQSRKVA